jgi:hypothetical protein
MRWPGELGHARCPWAKELLGERLLEETRPQRRLCGLLWRRSHHHYGSGKLAHRRKHAWRAIEVWKRVWREGVRAHSLSISERTVLCDALRGVVVRVWEHVGGLERLGPFLYYWREVRVAWLGGLGLSRRPLTG